MKPGLFNIFVPDLEEAEKFYSDILEFKIKSRGNNYLIFDCGEMELIAFKCEKEGKIGDYSNEARSVIVFEVESINSTFNRLKEKGIIFLHSKPVQNFLGWYAAFSDSFGIVHEIFERKEM